MRVPPFKLERYFARYEFSARYMLSSSDCELLSIGDLLAYEPGALEVFQQHWLGYTELQGSPELRSAIATLYDGTAADQILVHAGAEEGIFAFMNAILSPGDHLIVHAPAYQSLTEVARAIGCEVSLWQTRPEDHWALDLNWLRDTIRPNTRAIVINSPHNPTGYQMSHAVQDDLIAIARAHNLIVFSDEVYRFLEYDSADRLPALCDRYENAVSLGVMSKSFGLAGLRIGWLATRNRALLEQILAFKDYLTICNSAPSEFLATVALRHWQPIAARNLGVIHDNLIVLDSFFARHADRFTWQRPIAGSIAFPALHGSIDIETFCADLVARTGVMLVPGSNFDYSGQHFRLGFGRKNMPEAIAVLEKYVDGM